MDNKNMPSQFYLLSYEHDEIQALLDKINNGKVLNDFDYNELINKIGIENISTFSGSYEDLTDLPDLEAIVQKLIEENTDYLVEIIENWVDEQDKKLQEKFETEIDELKELQEGYATKEFAREYFKTKADIIHDHDDVYAVKDLEHNHENKEIIDSITAEDVQSWKNTADDLVQHKQDAADTYATKTDVAYDLNLKSNVGHNHDSDYGSKLKEHEHENKAVLDLIDVNKLAAWNQVISDLRLHIEDAEGKYSTKTELSEGLGTKSDLGHTHSQYATAVNEHIHENKAVIDLIFMEDLDKWDTTAANLQIAENEIDGLQQAVLNLENAFLEDQVAIENKFKDYTTTEDAQEQLQIVLENYYTTVEADLLYEDKVDKEDGMGLSANDFDDVYKSMLDEALEIEGNESTIVANYIRTIIDGDVNNLETTIGDLVNNKVDKIEGKELSANDFTDEYKAVIDDILVESNAKGFVHSVIDEDIADKTEGALGALLDNKVDKENGKGLSTNDFKTEHLQIIEEILDANGNSTKTAREFITDRIEESIREEATGSNAIGEALAKKSNIDHEHEQYVIKDGDKVLSDNNFEDNYKALLDEVNEYDTVKQFVDEVIFDSITNADEETIGAELAKKSDVGHIHEQYVEREQFAVKADNGQYEIVEGEASENQISTSDNLIAGMVAANILNVGDKVNLQDKVLSEANLTLQEKEYIVMMVTQGNLVFSNMIKASILAGDLKIVLDTKVDKKDGFSLVNDAQISKLESINEITNLDIDEAISEVFK